MGITLVASYRSKPSSDEESGLVLSVDSFEVTWVGNLEGSGPGNGDTLVNSEGNKVGNKLCIH